MSPIKIPTLGAGRSDDDSTSTVLSGGGDRRFVGRTAIVTGAGSGIGRATALRLAAEGASVACLDIAVDAAEQTVAQLAKEAEAVGASWSGGVAVAYGSDVTDEASVRAVVARVASELGAPSLLANVAGIGGFEHTVDVSMATWQKFLAVNLTGTFLLCRETLPHLLESGGAIVNTASTAGLVGSAYSAAYCASKGGVVMLTKALAIEYRTRGVRVNAVAPGGVDTPLLAEFGLPDGADERELRRIMTPMGFAQTAEIAAAIAFLLSEESGFTTGAILSIDGGIAA